MNFCKDCKHKEEVPHMKGNSEFWMCNSPKNNKGESPLTGEPVKFYIYCESLRKDYEECCGLDGVWFESIDNVVPE
jgi:hypothetical protein